MEKVDEVRFTRRIDKAQGEGVRWRGRHNGRWTEGEYSRCISETRNRWERTEEGLILLG